MSSTENLSPEHLLHYHADYQVLICKPCRYAVQPTGLARHLKEIHRIYRSYRRPYLDYCSRFNLARPEEINGLSIKEFPVPFLPIHEGLECLGPESCGYLCISTKRMQNHWSAEHGRRGSGVGNDWRPVKLQTFFRGNLLHYFTGSQPNNSNQVKHMQTHGTNVIGANTSFDVLDQHLYHHYLTSTYLTLVDRTVVQDVWGRVIPEMAQDHAFLMHAILSCSALHLAHKNSSKQQSYLLRAHSHQDIALPLFRQAVSNVDGGNCHAILAFSHLLVVYSFAADRDDVRMLLTDPSSPHPQLLCSWLFFARNCCLVVAERWGEIEKGPLGPLAQCWEAPGPELTDNMIQTRIQEQLLSLTPDNDGRTEEESWTAAVMKTYNATAKDLALAFAKTRGLRDDEFTCDAICSWPLRISTEYIELLNQAHPAALILLAHYGLLLERVGPHWYFEGRAKRLLSAVLERLGSHWRHAIQVSLEKILNFW